MLGAHDRKDVHEIERQFIDDDPRMQPEPRVRVGRVYDERTAQDGTRVLVDRLWPRGLTKNRADLDEWCKQIAPSAALRRW